VLSRLSAIKDGAKTRKTMAANVVMGSFDWSSVIRISPRALVTVKVLESCL
jgi:hypothetical protein